MIYRMGVINCWVKEMNLILNIQMKSYCIFGIAKNLKK